MEAYYLGMFFGLFKICVGQDDFVIIFYDFCLKVFFEVEFKFFEEFMWNWQMSPDVGVDMLTF